MRKFLFCLFTISILLLVFSYFFMLRSSNSSMIPESVFMLMLVNNTTFFRTNNNSNANNASNFPRLTSATLESFDGEGTKSRGQCNVGQRFNFNKEIRILGRKENQKACDPNRALLKVFMYDLPPKFHFGLLGWKGPSGKIWPDVTRIDSIPEYPGGLNLQHSIEYWLTLDLLSSNAPSVVRPCAAVRVNDSSQADIIFVPFFSSVSYNKYSKLHGKEKISRNRMLQQQLVEFLQSQEEWKKWNGKDHVILAHHPNSMLDARKKLGSAMFLLADFGRYPIEIANINKDIIAPYMHLVNTNGNDSAPFEERPILVFFQGAIYRKDGGIIRQELYYLLKDEKDVYFTFGSTRRNGINKAGQGMSSSKFCLHIAGDTPSSNRLFDAIASHCVPVIISDEIELPFEDVLDYSEFCIFVHASDAVKKGFLLTLLRGIRHLEWTRMWKRSKEIAHHFEYQYPSQPGDAVEMLWEAIARKISSVHLKLHRENRFHQSQCTDKHKMQLLKKGDLVPMAT